MKKIFQSPSIRVFSITPVIMIAASGEPEVTFNTEDVIDNEDGMDARISYSSNIWNNEW